MFNTGIARRSWRSRLANQNRTLWTPLAILASGSLGAVAAMIAALTVFLDPDMIGRHSGNSRSNQPFKLGHLPSSAPLVCKDNPVKAGHRASKSLWWKTDSKI